MVLPVPIANDVKRAGSWDVAQDSVTLDYEARFLRRKRLTADSGAQFVVDLPETLSLDHGDALVLEGDALIEVRAAPEALLEVTGPDLIRLAWHIGNRHTPCQIGTGALMIRRDHVLAEMLRGLGATLREVEAPFTPEGGAYGHGRTMGHDHGHAHASQHADKRTDPAAHAHHHLTGADIMDAAGGDGGE